MVILKLNIYMDLATPRCERQWYRLHTCHTTSTFCSENDFRNNQRMPEGWLSIHWSQFSLSLSFTPLHFPPLQSLFWNSGLALNIYLCMASISHVWSYWLLTFIHDYVCIHASRELAVFHPIRPASRIQMFNLSRNVGNWAKTVYQMTINCFKKKLM